MKIAGLDIGSSGCKCTVLDANGAILGRAYRDYPVRRQLSGHEVDISVVMEAVFAVLKEMASEHPDIGGIGVTSFGETFAMTGDDGEPMYPGILYTDPRGQDAIRAISEEMGERQIAAVTGLRPHSMYSLSRLHWMREHHPEICRKAKHIFLMEDYVIWHLTGKARIDYSLATRTMAFDIRSMTWSEPILKWVGVDPALLSEPVPTGTPAGTLTPAAARAVGLSERTLVVCGAHDQVAACVGAGAFEGSVAVDGAGTTACLTPVFDGMPNIDVMFDGYYSVVPYAVPGKYVAYAFTHTGGALVQWFVDTLAGREKDQAAREGTSVNALLEDQYRRAHGDAPSGLMVLPHFAGTGTPWMDNDATGVFVGMNLSTTAADLYRGCMEGVAYEMLLNQRHLKGSGAHYERLHATGGGARSAVWMQMKADVLNKPMTALKTVDAGTVGSAMLTGVALGVFADLNDAAAHMVKEIATYQPREDAHEAYMKVYERYEKLYGAIRSTRE